VGGGVLGGGGGVGGFFFFFNNHSSSSAREELFSIGVAQMSRCGTHSVHGLALVFLTGRDRDRGTWRRPSG